VPSEQGGFERVHVELDWYDGPRQGVADLDGVPHYFRAVHDYAKPDVPDDEYLLWPVEPGVLALEREQWEIFVAWNDRYEAATAPVETHPARGGVDRRYDELEARLETHRRVPADARRVTAEWQWGIRETHYQPDGPNYRVRWRAAVVADA